MTKPAIHSLDEKPDVRALLTAAARHHFATFGYGKTTLSDLTRSLGFSKANFYRYFKSKQEIGEAVCDETLNDILGILEEAVAGSVSASDKLRRLLRTLVMQSEILLLTERRLFDIAIIAHAESWTSSRRYRSLIAMMLERIIVDGRSAGEFERKTPLDETARAILVAMRPFVDPRSLPDNRENLPETLAEVISLVLRSLAP